MLKFKRKSHDGHSNIQERLIRRKQQQQLTCLDRPEPPPPPRHRQGRRRDRDHPDPRQPPYSSSPLPL